MAITQDGSLLAGIFEGLSTSRDSGCQWDFAKGALEKRFVIYFGHRSQEPGQRGAGHLQQCGRRRLPHPGLAVVGQRLGTSSRQAGSICPAHSRGHARRRAQRSQRLYVSGRDPARPSTAA